MAEKSVTTHCCNFRCFERKIQPLLKCKDTWVFRGQEKDDWKLKTSLERAFNRFKVEGLDTENIERRMIREFQRRLHQYTANVPDESELDEWMALMQHHGAPTRLLDFTYSTYVAAYFALDNSKPGSRVAIWAVNTDSLRRELKSLFPALAYWYGRYEKHSAQEAFEALFARHPRQRFVLSVTPYRFNERLAYQRGAFPCPRDLNTSFECILLEYVGKESPGSKVIKFTIPTGYIGTIRDNALTRLDHMNINRITLFPGLDGFAQSFEARIPLFKTIRW